MCRVSLQPAFNPCRGVSLIELIVTVSVLAILGGLAAPAFTGLWLDAQRTTAVNGFVHSVHLARSTAVHFGRTVTICRSTDGHTCSHRTEDWQAGWMVFVNRDDDRPPARDADESVLAVYPASPGSMAFEAGSRLLELPFVQEFVEPFSGPKIQTGVRLVK